MAPQDYEARIAHCATPEVCEALQAEITRAARPHRENLFSLRQANERASEYWRESLIDRGAVGVWETIVMRDQLIAQQQLIVRQFSALEDALIKRNDERRRARGEAVW
jgi:hypothetical protein